MDPSFVKMKKGLKRENRFIDKVKHNNKTRVDLIFYMPDQQNCYIAEFLTLVFGNCTESLKKFNTCIYLITNLF